MLSPYQYAVWFLCTILEAAVVVCAVKKNAFRRYILLNVYMAASVVLSIARYDILKHYGFSSKEYLYFYFYSDFLLTITLFFALISLYSYIFAELEVGRYIRTGAVVLLCGTAMFSYGVVQQSTSRLITHFVVEISQNLSTTNWSNAAGSWPVTNSGLNNMIWTNSATVVSNVFFRVRSIVP